MIDILNLEWTSYPSRDRNVATLVCNYLRMMGLSVVESSVFCGFEMIDRYRPCLLFLTNGTGAKVNFDLVKYATLRGIKVVTLVSEGNFKSSIELLPEFIWGWNKDHVLYERVNMQWSERTKEMTVQLYPQIRAQIKVSGAVGFDYYKIVPPPKKDSFLRKHRKEQYDKIIGWGCWDFTVVFPGDIRYGYFLSLYGSDVIARFQKDRDLSNQILLDLVERNTDILFLLKEHPGNTRGFFESGISGAEKYPNVLVLKKESIVDCISVSDFWLTYESTTVIEAWLLGKQTCLLNPSGIDFPRANVYKGSPNYPDLPKLQAAIDSFYSTNELPGFQAMEFERKEVIRETIQWDDGLNHVRAGNEIIRVLKEEEKLEKRDMPRYLNKAKWMQYLLSRGFPRRRGNFIYNALREFDHEALSSWSLDIYGRQIAYYKKMGLSKADLQTIIAI